MSASEIQLFWSFALLIVIAVTLLGGSIALITYGIHECFNSPEAKRARRRAKRYAR